MIFTFHVGDRALVEIVRFLRCDLLASDSKESFVEFRDPCILRPGPSERRAMSFDDLARTMQELHAPGLNLRPRYGCRLVLAAPEESPEDYLGSTM